MERPITDVDVAERVPAISINVPPVTIGMQQIVEWFHELHRMQVGVIRWLGWPTMKNPLDLWVYQHLLSDRKPDVIVETGTYWGGSALYLAMVCDAIDAGKVITIDNGTEGAKDCPKHPRIEYLRGDSVGSDIVAAVRARCQGQTVMVILDSDHRKPHVLKELEGYGPLVSPGQYLVVEDTNINGHPIEPQWGPGPWEALEEWLPKHPEFERDKECERFLYTWNPGGYLKRLEKPRTRRRKA